MALRRWAAPEINVALLLCPAARSSKESHLNSGNRMCDGSCKILRAVLTVCCSQRKERDLSGRRRCPWQCSSDGSCSAGWLLGTSRWKKRSLCSGWSSNRMLLRWFYRCHMTSWAGAATADITGGPPLCLRRISGGCQRWYPDVCTAEWFPLVSASGSQRTLLIIAAITWTRVTVPDLSISPANVVKSPKLQ